MQRRMARRNDVVSNRQERINEHGSFHASLEKIEALEEKMILKI
jgi:hypothetical protein